MRLKPHRTAEFTEKLEKQVIPGLRKQKGFQDEITFVSMSGTEAFAISLWDRAESAESYNREAYPELSRCLAGVLDGPAQVDTFDVANSTFHKIASVVTA